MLLLPVQKVSGGFQGSVGSLPPQTPHFLADPISSTISNSASPWTASDWRLGWGGGVGRWKSPHTFVSRYLLLVTEKDANTQDWCWHMCSPYQIVIIWRLVSLESKSYQGIKTLHHTRLPSYAVVQQPDASHCKESLDASSPHFPLPPGHGMLLPQLHHCINRTVQDLSPTSCITSLPQKWGLKCMTRKEGLSQMSSLSYLPQKAVLAQPKVQFCDGSRWPASLLLCSHSFPFHQLCLLTLFLVLALVFAWPNSKPVQWAIIAENYSTPSKRCFLLA